MFLSRNKKNNVYPCKPQFYYIKVGFKGIKIIDMFTLCLGRQLPPCKMEVGGVGGGGGKIFSGVSTTFRFEPTREIKALTVQIGRLPEIL